MVLRAAVMKMILARSVSGRLELPAMMRERMNDYDEPV